MKRLAVLVSNAGTGSNLQAIIQAIKTQELKAEIILVVSDGEDASGLKRAQENNILTLVINSSDNLLKILQEKNVDYICLAGWKQIISDEMLDKFKNRILNIHPGLIPDSLDGVVKNPDGSEGLWNKGKFTNIAIQNFFDQHATYAGSTVHFLSKEFDFGKVLKRCFVKIEKEDNVDSLYQKLKVEENKIYVEALIQLCNE
ncbi:hypothetical protein HY025_01905 [Candidatus Daviesbacteria bacterium]|nr:hypothetical protein [Candidatus Daviesbacteria bacterium]